MARFARLKVLNRMIETGMVPVFYNADIEVAKKVAAAVFSGGCPFLEFTNRAITPRKSLPSWSATAPASSPSCASTPATGASEPPAPFRYGKAVASTTR